MRKLKVKLLIEEDDNLFVGLQEELTVEWCDRSDGQWRASNPDQGCIFWVGFGEDVHAAILEYLKARLGRGYSYQQLARLERGEISTLELASDLRIPVGEVEQFMQSNEPEGDR